MIYLCTLMFKSLGLHVGLPTSSPLVIEPFAMENLPQDLQHPLQGVVAVVTGWRMTAATGIAGSDVTRMVRRMGRGWQGQQQQT